MLQLTKMLIPVTLLLLFAINNCQSNPFFTASSTNVRPTVLSATLNTPALGDIVPPVQWPFPPAPTSGSGQSEFPLMERFIRENNRIDNNWNQKLEPKSTAQEQHNYPAQQAPPPSQQPPSQSLSQYVREGLLIGQHVRPMMTSSQQPVMPPPLDPREHFHVTGNSGSGGQQRRFRLDTVRVRDDGSGSGNGESRDKLNVSFIMPSDAKPLTLNFDTKEVFWESGDEKKSFPVDKVNGQLSPSMVSSLDSILNKYDQKSNQQTGSSGPILVATSGGTQEERDGDYIVVRHDLNKYAYDLPQGNGKTETPSSGSPRVEKYDISGQKELRFTLGRVSG